MHDAARNQRFQCNNTKFRKSSPTPHRINAQTELHIENPPILYFVETLNLMLIETFEIVGRWIFSIFWTLNSLVFIELWTFVEQRNYWIHETLNLLNSLNSSKIEFIEFIKSWTHWMLNSLNVEPTWIRWIFWKVNSLNELNIERFGHVKHWIYEIDWTLSSLNSLNDRLFWIH